MKYIKLIWLDIVFQWWTLLYALVTAPGQLLPEGPTQAKLYAKAMEAAFNIQLWITLHENNDEHP